MKKLLLAFALLPLASSAQKGFMTIEGTGHFGSDFGAGFGGELSGNGRIVQGLYGGLSIGIIKFDDLPKAYLPITAKFTFAPVKDFRKATPLFIIQPGYGAYTDQDANNTTSKASGGFTFFGGVGFATNTSKKGRGVVTLGYNSYGLKTPTATVDQFGNLTIKNQSKQYGGFTFKLGIMFQ